MISPVGEIRYGDREITINDASAGPISQKFYKAINDIQYGDAEDSMGWIESV